MAVESKSQKKNLVSFLPLVGEAYSSVGIESPKDISQHLLLQFNNGKNKKHLLVFLTLVEPFRVSLIVERTRMVVGIGSKSIGLWAGNMVHIIPTQAIELGTFEWVKRAITTSQEKWKETGRPKLEIGHISIDFSLNMLSLVAVASVVAGFVSTLACHPLEVLKDRLTISAHPHGSCTIINRQGTRSDATLPRLGSKLFKSDAFFRHHLDVL
nr:probable mitochondrial adenine nucleotide transporter BTL1 [Ipomoea batatas]